VLKYSGNAEKKIGVSNDKELIHATFNLIIKKTFQTNFPFSEHFIISNLIKSFHSISQPDGR
jgi:hypothetical protein